MENRIELLNKIEDDKIRQNAYELIEWWFDDVQDLIARQDHIIVHDGYGSMCDVAHEFVNDGVFGNVSEKLKYYIDYEELGDALYEGGNFLITDDCVFEYWK